MENKQYSNYTIHWTVKMTNWQPVDIPGMEPFEDEIVDFTESNDVLEHIMSL